MRIRRIVLIGLCSSIAWADFSYEQTTRITGGAMQGMMKMAGAFSKQAREPQKSTVMVKGDRLVNASARNINIIDLNAETMTDIDLEKKTYSVITFAQFTQALQRLSEKMGQQKNDAEINFKADVKNTGATKNIAGLDTKQTILTLTMEATDKKSGQQGGMDMQMDMWMAPDMPGYGEVRAFYSRMAQKMSWSPSAGMMGPLMGQNRKGMAELMKEMSKLEGIPVLQITRMGGAGGPGGAGQGQAEPQRQQQPQPDVQEAAGAAAAGAALGRLGGRLGGLGGFGRKKKEPEPQQAPPPEQAQAPQQQQQVAAGVLMEMTTELTGFSSSVDASKFDVPSGFKQTEHPMAKELK